jgi:chromosome segregation ATPase
MRKKLALSDEKMEINEKLCNDKIDIIEREFKTVKDEAEKIREESQKRNEQLRATKNDLETTRKSYEELKEQKSLLMEEINRVRGLYESSLKDKERLFDQKIKEIRTVVEESDRRRKVDRQEVEKASREYKRVRVRLCRFWRRSGTPTRRGSRSWRQNYSGTARIGELIVD